jgi:site-specific recombinase XerD
VKSPASARLAGLLSDWRISLRARRPSPATVAKHYRSLQQLFKWLTEDGEIPRSPMERMSPPSVPEQPVPILTDDDLAALLAAWQTDDRGGAPWWPQLMLP